MKNQRSLVRIPALLIFSVMTGCLSPGPIHYEPGLYEGTGQGHNGTIKVQILVSGRGIEDIEILEHNEDAFEALEELKYLALETGSADLDAVSGATISSEGFLSALRKALQGTPKRDDP